MWYIHNYYIDETVYMYLKVTATMLLHLPDTAFIVRNFILFARIEFSNFDVSH